MVIWGITAPGISGAASASFAYDGDGQRVKGVVNGTTTIYIGKYLNQSHMTSVGFYAII